MIYMYTCVCCICVCTCIGDQTSIVACAMTQRRVGDLVTDYTPSPSSSSSSSPTEPQSPPSQPRTRAWTVEDADHATTECAKSQQQFQTCFNDRVTDCRGFIEENAKSYCSLQADALETCLNAAKSNPGLLELI